MEIEIINGTIGRGHALLSYPQSNHLLLQQETQKSRERFMGTKIYTYGPTKKGPFYCNNKEYFFFLVNPIILFFSQNQVSP